MTMMRRLMKNLFFFSFFLLFSLFISLLLNIFPFCEILFLSFFFVGLLSSLLQIFFFYKC